MKCVVFFFSLLIFGNVSAKTVRMVQAAKTFMGDITDAQASEAYDNPLIEEKHKTVALTLKTGDEISFINRDEVSHNVSGSLNDKTEFDVKLQGPGKENDRSIKLTKKGDYIIQCAIHPKMQLKVKVE